MDIIGYTKDFPWRLNFNLVLSSLVVEFNDYSTPMLLMCIWHVLMLMILLHLQKILNDALMGILSVRDLISPPYVSTIPSVNVHRISKDDHFVIVASDGLFDFFSNDEVVQIVNTYIQCNPSADPAKYIVNQLILRAANSAGKLRATCSCLILFYIFL